MWERGRLKNPSEYRSFSDVLQAVWDGEIRPGSTIETSMEEPELTTSEQIDDAIDLLDKYNIRLDRWVDREPGSYWITPPDESAEDGAVKTHTVLRPCPI